MEADATYTVSELAEQLAAMAAQIDSLASENARLAADNEVSGPVSAASS